MGRGGVLLPATLSLYMLVYVCWWVCLYTYNFENWSCWNCTVSLWLKYWPDVSIQQKSTYYSGTYSEIGLFFNLWSGPQKCGEWLHACTPGHWDIDGPVGQKVQHLGSETLHTSESQRTQCIKRPTVTRSHKNRDWLQGTVWSFALALLWSGATYELPFLSH